MMTQVNFDSIGGGGNKVILVGVSHASNANAITTGKEDFPSDQYVIGDGLGSGMTISDSHTATNYGGTFDFTLALTSSVSVRLYSDTYMGHNYFSADVIKGGVTIQSSQQIPTPVRIDNAYTVTFGVAV